MCGVISTIGKAGERDRGRDVIDVRAQERFFHDARQNTRFIVVNDNPVERTALAHGGDELVLERRNLPLRDQPTLSLIRARESAATANCGCRFWSSHADRLIEFIVVVDNGQLRTPDDDLNQCFEFDLGLTSRRMLPVKSVVLFVSAAFGVDRAVGVLA